MGNHHSEPKITEDYEVAYYFTGSIILEGFGCNERKAIKELKRKCVKYGYSTPKWDDKNDMYFCGTIQTRIFTFQKWKTKKNPVWFFNRGEGVVARVYF